MKRTLLAMTISALLIGGFTQTISAQTTSIAMVGKAFKDKKCTSGSVSSTFSDCAGYIITLDCAAPFDFTGMQNQLKSDIAAKYSVTSSNTTIVTATNKSTVVVIKYEKPISAWNCSLVRYAAGFGNSRSEAEADAVKNKELDHKSSPWSFVEELKCETVLSTVSNTNQENSNIVYPNPAQTSITWSDNTNYTIYNLQGQELLQGKGTNANINELPKGTYILKLNEVAQKFVKE